MGREIQRDYSHVQEGEGDSDGGINKRDALGVNEKRHTSNHVKSKDT